MDQLIMLKHRLILIFILVKILKNLVTFENRLIFYLISVKVCQI